MLLDLLKQDLLFTEDYLLNLAISASHRYKEYEIPKKDGSKRKIEQPSIELKLIQRYLLDNVLSPLPIHDSATAYRINRSIKDHVQRHVNNNFLLRMDFKDFFPSLSADDITNHLDKYGININKDWIKADSDLLTKFVCRNGNLTIGAATSPFLSNTLCFELDNITQEICDKQNVTYSRYADDLYFSTQEPNLLSNIEGEIKKIITKISYPKKLVINEEKTRHNSKKHRRVITGLVISSTGNISLGRSTKRRIKSLIYNWEKLEHERKLYLTGFLSYCKTVEPSFMNSLYKKYGSPRIKEIQNFINTISLSEDLE